MPVILNPENIEPFQVYQQCRGQLIMAGMDGQPIDISIPAIEIVMGWMGIKNKWACAQKVLKMARCDIHDINEQRKNERQSKGK